MIKFIKNIFRSNKKDVEQTILNIEEYVEPTEYIKLGVTYKVGDRIICRSNEPGQLDIGVIISMFDNDGKWHDPIPVYKSEITDKEYLGMGIIRHYSKFLVSLLKDMSDLEQWNFLCHNHIQIEEKYGEKIPTFKKLSIDNIENNIVTFKEEVDFNLMSTFNTSNCKVLVFTERVNENQYKIADTNLKDIRKNDTLTIINYEKKRSEFMKPSNSDT
jgi:hypothetical protein